MARLECSKSTLHRAINSLKDHLNAPVVLDAEAGGYRYGKRETGEAFELPGLWFTAHELQALALMQRLIKDAGGGLLEEHSGARSRSVVSRRGRPSLLARRYSRCVPRVERHTCR